MQPANSTLYSELLDRKAQGQSAPCTPPDDLGHLLHSSYPAGKIVTFSDVSKDEQDDFPSEAGSRCPGLAAVDFYGDGKPTSAIELVWHLDKYPTTKLFIAHKPGNSWLLRPVDKADGPVPVVFAWKYGNYLGVAAMGVLDPSEPKDQWFHECTMIVRDNNAVIDMLPVVIHKGRKGYSSSDGGFLTYRARFEIKGSDAVAEMRLMKSDYLIFPAGETDHYSKIESFPVTVHDDQVTIRDVRYKPAAIKKDRLDELLKLLKTEPLEKDGR